MSPSDDQPARSGPHGYPVSLARSAAPWKRPASAHTTLPNAQNEVLGWGAARDRLAAYRALLGSSAELPLAFPQVPVMALHLDLLSQWSFPIRAMGIVHRGTMIEVLDELPPAGWWDVRAWVSGGRHVRSGLEFDLRGEVSVGGRACWRSTGIMLSRSKSASGAEASTVPRLDTSGEWDSEQPIPIEEGVGRTFGRLTGDVNPIHLHSLSARLFGFRRAIAHGWWTTGRTMAVLGVDEAVPGRRLDIAFRRPVELPSTPVLFSRGGAQGAVEFALLPDPAGPSDGDVVRPLVAGAVSG